MPAKKRKRTKKRASTKKPTSKASPQKKRKSPTKKRRKSRRKRPLFKRISHFLLVCFIWIITLSILLLTYYLHDLPSTDILTKKTQNHSIRLLSTNGEVITTLGSTYGKEVAYNTIPPHLIQAVLATEDRRFFKHFGFDIVGFMRAMVSNIKAGRIVQGGSTLTQQLAKIVFLSPDRTLKRKTQELVLALWLEHQYDKEDILAMYLNRVYFGSGFYGLSAASQGYFGKKPHQLSLSESAMLAGLLKAPSRYSPFTNPELSKARATQVMVNMVDAGYISVGQAIDIGNVVKTRTKMANSRLYFVDWLASQIPDYIGIINSNITIHTTLDLQLQSHAEKAIDNILSKQGRARNANQAALVALSPRGEVIAMVGGKDYSKSQFNRVTQAQRQPGSAFKYFVYLAALEAGWRPRDTILDEPITIKDWSPKNWDDYYRGATTIKEAFANSINSVAVRLSERIGRHDVINMAYRLGITSSLQNLPSIALGTSEVTLLEMAQAYAHLPNGGNHVSAYGIKKIVDENNNIIYQRRGSYSRQEISNDIVAHMNALLKSVMDEGTGKRAKLLRDTAGKTGTTQEFRDAWFIGYTPQVVSGVWLGNDDNSPMDGVTGGSLAGQIWKKFMASTHKTLPPLKIPTQKRWSNFLGLSWNKKEDERGSFWDNIMDMIESEEQSQESGLEWQQSN